MKDLLFLENIVKHFSVKGKYRFLGFSRKVCALDGINLTLNEGETLGLVGESGSGKTTLARIILGLIPPTSGKVWFIGKDLLSVGKSELRSLRRYMQAVFQNPSSSLNPRLTVEEIITEPFEVYKEGSKKEHKKKAEKLLHRVGLSTKLLSSYPFELSLGQQQRICIARALALNPRLVILDEPVSSLDVSLQAQILNLLKDLKKEFNLAYLFISHDLSVVGHMSDRVGVMYLGKIVELAEQKKLFKEPYHPYSASLLVSSFGLSRRRKEEKFVLRGEPPSPINLPSGCRFHLRCLLAQDICREEEPELREISDSHFAACHFKQPILV